MTTRPALAALSIFNENPTREHASSLVDIPALHAVLRYEYTSSGKPSQHTLDMCHWLHKRGVAVLKDLMVYRKLDTDASLETRVDNWEEVTHYHSLLTVHLTF